jgi:hypothetical protein
MQDNSRPFGHGEMFIFGRDQRVEITRKAVNPGRGHGWPGHERGAYVWIRNAAGREARVPLTCVRVDDPATVTRFGGWVKRTRPDSNRRDPR